MHGFEILLYEAMTHVKIRKTVNSISLFYFVQYISRKTPAFKFHQKPHSIVYHMVTDYNTFKYHKEVHGLIFC